MAIEKVLYTAHAQATGGRDGRAVSSDKVLDIQLSTPRELGGAGGPGTNPEQLFAAGYSACFLGALKFVAAREKVSLPADTRVSGQVGIGAIPTGFGIALGNGLFGVDVTFLLGVIVDAGIVDGIGQRTTVLFNQRDDGPLAIARSLAASHENARGHPDRKHEHDDQRDAVRKNRTH